MKSGLRFVLAGLAGWAVCSSPAQAEDGAYVSVRAGLAQAQAFNADVGTASAVANGLQEHDRIGYGADLAAGYELGPLRFELEASQKRARLNSLFTAGTVTVPNSATASAAKGTGTFTAPTGTTRTRSLMANLFISTTNRDVFDDGNVHFFGGAGVGYAWSRAFNHRAVEGADAYLHGGAKSFAWQVMIGGRYDLNAQLSLDASYKYFSATRLAFTDTAQRRVAGAQNWNGFQIGASYRF